MIYAGIGARATPLETLRIMYAIGHKLASIGWTLSTGGTTGADQAFEVGAREAGGELRVYLPWSGFEMTTRGSYTDDTVVESTPCLRAIAAAHHPAWERLSQGVQRLMVRNVAVVLGEHAHEPVDCVVGWTVDGHDSGGTGHAMRVARAHGIEVFNLHDHPRIDALAEFVQS